MRRLPLTLRRPRIRPADRVCPVFNSMSVGFGATMRPLPGNMWGRLGSRPVLGVSDTTWQIKHKLIRMNCSKRPLR